MVALVAGNDARVGGPLHTRVEDLLAALREQGRRAVRIVDLECGTGRRIRRVARRARALGFVAVEARGCARSREAAEVARRVGTARPDLGVGYQFDAADPNEAWRQEAHEGADLIIGPDWLATGERR